MEREEMMTASRTLPYGWYLVMDWNIQPSLQPLPINHAAPHPMQHKRVFQIFIWVKNPSLPLTTSDILSNKPAD